MAGNEPDLGLRTARSDVSRWSPNGFRQTSQMGQAVPQGETGRQNEKLAGAPRLRSFAGRTLHASFRPRLAAVALAFSLALHLHQVGQRTFTSKLLSMPSTQLSRSAVD